MLLEAAPQCCMLVPTLIITHAIFSLTCLNMCSVVVPNETLSTAFGRPIEYDVIGSNVQGESTTAQDRRLG